jgi:2-methylaconitate cis-trans-isomerase PrpF
VHAIHKESGHTGDTVAIGHPSGVMTIEARTHEENGACVVDRAVFARTVRPIMRGEVWVRRAEVERLTEVLPADARTRTGVPVPD